MVYTMGLVITICTFFPVKTEKQKVVSFNGGANSSILPRKQHHIMLRKFQKIGIRKIEHLNGRALLADEMGLGKTLQVITWMQSHPEITHILVVCPSSLKWNWVEEIKKWTGSINDWEVLTGQTPYTPTKSKLIINYDILPHWRTSLLPELLIMDECHYVKTYQSQRAKACRALAKKARYVVGMTGTPLENNPVDIYNSVSMIKPGIFANKQAFQFRYCNPKHNGFGWVFKGCSNDKELHLILKKHVMIRRLKSEVLSELPEKHQIDLLLEIHNRKEYQKAENQFFEYLKEKIDLTHEKNLQKILENLPAGITAQLNKSEIEQEKQERIERAERGGIRAQWIELRQLAAKGKMLAVVEWIENFLTSNPGEKLVVFGIHKEVLNILYEKFAKIAVRIDGSVPVKSRHHLVNQFQTNAKIRLFLGNIEAAGVGLTLTRACTLLLVEHHWNPAKTNQAIDRVHRITQTRQVTIYRAIAVNTIEHLILKTQDVKKGFSDKIVDGKNN